MNKFLALSGYVSSYSDLFLQLYERINIHQYQHHQSEKEALLKHEAPVASTLPFLCLYRSKNPPTYDLYSGRTMELQGAILGAGFKYKQMTASFQGHDTEDQKTRLGAKYISLHLALLP